MTRTGRDSRLTKLVLLREASAANAHVAAFGENGKRYGEAARNFNAKHLFIQTATRKSVRDRYKRLQERFYKSYKLNQRLSGVDGEIGEVEELLMAVPEARDDLAVKRTAKKTAQQETDREKEMIGQALVDMSLKRKTAEDTSEDSIDEVPAIAKKTNRVKRMESGAEMERFGVHLRARSASRALR